MPPWPPSAKPMAMKSAVMPASSTAVLIVFIPSSPRAARAGTP